MASLLKVENIAHTNGTTAVSIDSSGRVALPNRPYAFVDFGATAAYVSHSAGSILIFDNAMVNDGNHYNTSSGVWTCPVDGLYQVNCSLLSQNANDAYGTQVWIDGVKTTRNGTNHRSVSFSNTFKLTATQTIDIRLSQTMNLYEDTLVNRYCFAMFIYLG